MTAKDDKAEKTRKKKKRRRRRKRKRIRIRMIGDSRGFLKSAEVQKSRVSAGCAAVRRGFLGQTKAGPRLQKRREHSSDARLER